MKKTLINKLLIGLSLFTLSFNLLACTVPSPGPDKTVGGAILGAAWGAGAGAVVGNQLIPDRAGEGTAIGAGLGLVSGALSGIVYDSIEDKQLQQEQRLAALKLQNISNGNNLAKIQQDLDHSKAMPVFESVYKVYFDVDQTNLRAGAIKNLETFADNIKRRPAGYTVNVVGHTDDTGLQNYNDHLAKARAESVSSYLMARGLDVSSVVVTGVGASQPVASNTTAEGRQLNRRVDVSLSKN
jgi:outer membrane protein OmpA-like peptidoglycan-associated protein